MSGKYTSQYQSGDLTPDETKEIWRRIREQFGHDNTQEIVSVKTGNDNYVMRQIAFYIDQVKAERVDKVPLTAVSDSAPWDDVLKALGGLYEKWARNGGEARETRAALADLMQAYDRWLD